MATTTYTIIAKNPEFSGEVAGVDFSRGVGEAVDPAPHIKAYFERHGYDVVKKGGRKPAAKSEPKTPAKTDPEPKTDPNGDGPKE